MAYEIGPKIGIDGESEFRKSINDIVQSVKTLGTEMKAVSSKFGENQNSQDALTAKNKVLTKQIEQQKERLKLLTDGLQKCSEKYGENDERTMRWKSSVNTATAELNRMENELSQNTKELKEMDAGLRDTETGLKNTKEEAGRFGDVFKANLLSSVIVSGVKFLKDAVVELASSMKEAVVDSAAYADEILTLSTQTGLSTQKLQEFSYASELVDVSVDTLTKSMAKNIKSMSSARDGSEAYANAYEKLGVSVVDVNGNLRDGETVYFETIDALGKVANETERDSIAMQLFGKSAQELNPLIEAGSETMKAFASEAQGVGYVLDEEMLSSLGAVDDSIQRFKVNAEGIKNQIVAGLAPVISDLAVQFLEFSQNINWENVGKQVGAVADNVKEFGTFVIENKDNILATISGIGAGFIAWNVATMIQGVVGAIKAFKLANEGATIAQLALNAAQKANPIGMLVTLIAGLVTAVVVLWNTNEEFRNNVISVWNSVKNAVSSAVNSVCAFFSNLGSKAKELGSNIKSGIMQGVDYIASLPSKMISIGGNLITGLWNGISDKIGWILGKIRGFGSSVISAIKGIFGVHSPSVVMKEIGMYLAQGLAIGYSDEMPDSIKKMKNAFDSADLQNGKLFASARTEINTTIDYDRLERMQGKGIYLNGRLMGREMREMGVVFSG